MIKDGHGHEAHEAAEGNKKKKKVEHEHHEEVDVIAMIAINSYTNLLEDYMKESMILHKEFWSELKEEKPELTKLN